MDIKLKEYVKKFNNDDNEYFKQDISNQMAGNWLSENIPLIDIPDKLLEEIYYFRWWVFRKHIKTTADGFVITEFLPEVPWGGTYNTIIAAAGHHIAEAKWLKCGKRIIEDYFKLWLEEKSKTYSYSSWIIYSLYEYCTHTNDFSFGVENLSLLMRYYDKIEAEHMSKCGLMWSVDGVDAMEYSISGSLEGNVGSKGIRPTLNSYMAANAFSIAVFAEKAGENKISQKYMKKHLLLKEKINELLWDKDFYKAIHSENLENPSIDKVFPENNVRELIGYIPWCFNIAPEGYEIAFEELKKEDGFKSPYGLTTAEKRHSRYLYEANHECLWNGYIWPFATTQVLDAMITVLNKYKQNTVTKEDFYEVLSQYAKMHYLEENGKKVCWIDEVKKPTDNTWSSRDILKDWGWQKNKGGFERGKDYNHSAFCNIIISGLLGISAENGVLTVNPKIPDDWERFSVDNLWINDILYKITYDKSRKDKLVVERKSPHKSLLI